MLKLNRKIFKSVIELACELEHFFMLKGIDIDSIYYFKQSSYHLSRWFNREKMRMVKFIMNCLSKAIIPPQYLIAPPLFVILIIVYWITPSSFTNKLSDDPHI